MSKLRVGTLWLDGCSGCHMSLLDIDEQLIELAPLVDLVRSPLVDAKEWPEQVDLALVEGAVSTEEDLKALRKARAQTHFLIALGDCAVTSNVPGMRNQHCVEAIEKCAFLERAQVNRSIPREGVPRLLPQSLPLLHYIKVDLFLPGCPPPAEAIYAVIKDLIAGRPPGEPSTRFGS